MASSIPEAPCAHLAASTWHCAASCRATTPQILRPGRDGRPGGGAASSGPGHPAHLRAIDRGNGMPVAMRRYRRVGPQALKRTCGIVSTESPARGTPHCVTSKCLGSGERQLELSSPSSAGLAGGFRCAHVADVVVPVAELANTRSHGAIFSVIDDRNAYATRIELSVQVEAKYARPPAPLEEGAALAAMGLAALAEAAREAPIFSDLGFREAADCDPPEQGRRALTHRALIQA